MFDVMRSVLGLAGPLSMYHDLVIASLICNFFLGGAVYSICEADPFLRYVVRTLSKQATSKFNMFTVVLLH